VRFIDLDIAKFAIVLEFMSGGSLYSFIKKQKKDTFLWTDRYQMMLDTCEGMAYLHSVTHADGTAKPRVYHQDLKSANVLLSFDKDGKLRGKISDFGLSGILALALLYLIYQLK
jgi:serine/threonine protein kinase